MSYEEIRHFVDSFGDVRGWLRSGDRLSAAKCAFWTCRRAEQMEDPRELADLTDEQMDTLKTWSVFDWDELEDLADLLATY